jgi:hypothetical protein
METEEAAIERETKQILRHIQYHLSESHVALGAIKESAGMMDVFYHPTSALPTLNYVTPRRNTAYVSRTYVQQGLDVMTQLERTQRVLYVEGLYPPQFAKSLRELGLQLEHETPIMSINPAVFAVTGSRHPWWNAPCRMASRLSASATRTASVTGGMSGAMVITTC